jgi:hypothetical protein
MRVLITSPPALLFLDAGGDNALLGTAVSGSSTSNLWSGELVVRLSTKLYANRCEKAGGPSACTATFSWSSPEGDRLGSKEVTLSDSNHGGAIGNWGDMGTCCSGTTYARYNAPSYSSSSSSFPPTHSLLFPTFSHSRGPCVAGGFRTCSEVGSWATGYSGNALNTGTFGTGKQCR